MNWYAERKITYGLLVLTVVLGLALYLFRDTIFPAPTCTDKKMNGYETGIDCGGTCALVCKGDVKPLTVLWSRFIKNSEDTYDLVAFIANKNINNASADGLKYTFLFYDVDGKVIQTIKGKVSTPVDGSFPIVKTNVQFVVTPKKMAFFIEDGPHYVIDENPTDPTIKVLDRKYEPGSIPRVYAEIKNTKRIVISNLPVYVILYDEENKPYEVGSTVIPLLDKEELKRISFTWKHQLVAPPTRIGVYPVLDPFGAVR
jgi:hypothetical protein